MPADNRITGVESARSACRCLSRSSCAARRSLRSLEILAKPITAPASSFTAVITTLAQKREPSLRTRQPSSSKRPTSAAISSSFCGFVVRSSSG